MDPLLSLRTLSTDIEHAVGQISDDEGSLGDTSSLDTRSKYVLVVRNIIWRGDAVDRVKVAVQVRVSKKYGLVEQGTAGKVQVAEE